VLVEQEIKLSFPEEAEYIANDAVDIPSGLDLHYKPLPADPDRADRQTLAAQGIDLPAYLSTAFADPRNNAVLGFYLDIEGKREYISLPGFAGACADYRAAHPEIPLIGWEDMAGILSLYKGRELQAVSPRGVEQLSRVSALSLSPETGAGWDSRAGFLTPLDLHLDWNTPRFSLNAYLGGELGVETLYHKIRGGASAVGAPLPSLPGLQVFGGAEAEARAAGTGHPAASGGKARLGLLYDRRVSPGLRWRNALAGKFLVVLLDNDIQSTAWKGEYESVLRIGRWSPYLKAGALFAQNRLFLAKNALYRDFIRDAAFDQLEAGTSLELLGYKDRFALDLTVTTDIAAGSLGLGLGMVLQSPGGPRWDLSVLGLVSPLEDWYAGLREKTLDTTRITISSALRWPSGFFIRAGYELNYSDRAPYHHRVNLNGGWRIAL
jgi:hypothetical protein